MSGSDWIITIRVRAKNMVDHAEPDAEAAVRWCLEEEGLYGCADWPEDYTIVSIEPDKEPTP